jgi:hypothetical protein
MNEYTLRIHELVDQANALGTSVERVVAESSIVPRAITKLRLKYLRERADRIGASIERALAWDAAVSLAYEERTGKQLQPGEAFPDVDGRRALEILKLYPRASK